MTLCLTAALSTGGSFAEIFVEDKFNTSIRLLGGKVEKTVCGRDFGVGIRIFDGFNAIYAYTNDHKPEALIAMALRAAQAVGKTKQDLTLSLMKESIEPASHLRKFPAPSKPQIRLL